MNQIGLRRKRPLIASNASSGRDRWRPVVPVSSAAHSCNGAVHGAHGPADRGPRGDRFFSRPWMETTAERRDCTASSRDGRAGAAMAGWPARQLLGESSHLGRADAARALRHHHRPAAGRATRDCVPASGVTWSTGGRSRCELGFTSHRRASSAPASAAPPQRSVPGRSLIVRNQRSGSAFTQGVEQGDGRVVPGAGSICSAGERAGEPVGDAGREAGWPRGPARWSRMVRHLSDVVLYETATPRPGPVLMWDLAGQHSRATGSMIFRDTSASVVRSPEHAQLLGGRRLSKPREAWPGGALWAVHSRTAPGPARTGSTDVRQRGRHHWRRVEFQSISRIHST